MNKLILTSLFFFIPFYISISERSVLNEKWSQKKERNSYEIIISLLLFINIICSLAFWSNPIQNSIIHRIDAIFARVSIVFFTIYFLFYKETKLIMKNIYLSTLINGVIMFYFSDENSRIEWCSENHINSHFIFHIFSIIGSITVVL